jgi:hypothetical protein
MIQSFFVWLLGPDLALVFLLGAIMLSVFAFATMLINAYEILYWWSNRNARK